MRAVEAAPAGLNHHDVLGERLAVLTAEPHLHRPGLLGHAAPAVHARAAVLGPVFLHARTPSVGEPDCFGRLLGLAAFLALFQAAVHRLSTRPHFTDPGLFHQAAFGVVIGNPGGDAGSTSL